MKIFLVVKSPKYFRLIALLFITSFVSLFAQKTFDRERYLEATKGLKTVFTKE